MDHHTLPHRRAADGFGLSGRRHHLGARVAAVAAAAALGCSQASALVLGFDDIGNDGPVPASYAGLDWSTGGWTVFSLPQEPYTAHSGAARITTGFAAADASSSIGFADDVRLDGAWFAGLPGVSLTLRLWNDGVLVHESALLDVGATPVFLASGYAGWIDHLQVHSANHGEFVLDDLTFTPAVPEPAAAWLLLAGGAAVLGLVRRARRARSC